MLAALRRPYVWVPISAGLLAFVVIRTRPWEAAGLVAGLEPLPLLVAAALNAPVVLLWAVRSRLLMAGVGHPLTLGELVPVVSFANTINNLTPASSGEVLRAVVLKQRHGVPYTRSGAVILVERLWAIGIMALTAGAAALGPLLGGPPGLAAAGWLLAALLCFVPSFSYAAGLRPGRIVRRTLDRRVPPAIGVIKGVTAEVEVSAETLGATVADGPTPGRGRRIAAAFVELDEVLGRVVTDPGQALGFVISTVAIFTCFTLQLAFILSALEVPLPPDAVWAALGLATIAGVVSALPFGLGATDAVLVLLLTAMGSGAPAAGAAVLLLRALVTLPLGVAGAVSWAVLSRTRDVVRAP